MQADSMRWLLVAAAWSAAACAEVPTIPVQSRLVARDGTPVVGRVQTRTGTIDLTRSSVAEGGAARELGRGVARVMADIDPSLTSTSSQSTPTTTTASPSAR